MKIVEINTFSNGSTGKIASGYVKKYIAEGHDCILLYARGPEREDIPSKKISNSFGIRLHGVLSRIFDNHGLNSGHSTKRLIKFLQKYDPDIIHLHNIHGYYLNYKILFAYLRESRAAIQWTLHDCWSFTGHCAYFSYVGCDKWLTCCNKCPQKHSYPKSFFLDRSKRNYILKKSAFTSIPNNRIELFVPSQWLKDLVAKSFLADYKCSVVRNTIDQKIFYPCDRGEFRQKYALMDKKIILGVANVWEKRKGYDYFLELDSKIDHNYAVIVLVGVSKKQKKWLSRHTSILPICRTENQRELAEIYSTSDVFFNPTLEENYPTVNLEAQHCGTMVFTFDTGGAKETDIGKGLLRITSDSVYVKQLFNYIFNGTNK